jgi:hypothetical protein
LADRASAEEIRCTGLCALSVNTHVTTRSDSDG